LRIEPEHFQRWLELFIESTRETLPKPQAEQAAAQASHMAQCFSGIFPSRSDGKPSRTASLMEVGHERNVAEEAAGL